MKSKQKKRTPPQPQRSEKDGRLVSKPTDSPSSMNARTPSKAKRSEVAKKKQKSSSSWSGFFLIVTARLALYYALYLYIWTCPEVSDSESPLVCKSGDWLKDKLQPHIEPVYNEHLAPYVDKVSPYVKTANDKYLYPAGVFVAKQYNIYGKPRYEEAKVIVLKEYYRIVAPRVEKVVNRGNEYYGQYLADHVATGKEIYHVVQPHVSYAAGKAYEKGYPIYVASLPYAEAAWVKFMELLGWVTVEGKGWVSRRWGMHVEPQLSRIQQKLGRKIAGDEADGTSAVTDTTPSAPSNPNDSATADDTPLPAHLRPEIREAIDEDLKVWNRKFDTAGEKAIAEVQEKLDTLCSESLEKHKVATNDMLDVLEDHAATELENLVKSIDELSASHEPKERKEEAVVELVKTASLKIHDESKKIQTHAKDILGALYDKTRETVDSALVVLDAVHDLGMQELGMKWAWMDGVTYKDWARYHDLKKSFDGARNEVIRAGQTHKGLREFTDFANSVESEAKGIAEEASKKLLELEKTGFKERPVIEVSEPEGKAEEVAAEPAEDVSKIRDMGFEVDNHGHIVNDDNHDEDAPPHKHVHPESEKLMDAVEQQVLKAEEADAHSNKKVAAKSSVFAEARKQEPIGKKAQEQAKSLSYSISSAFSEATKAASEAIYGKTPASQSISSVAKEKFDAAVAAASKVLYGTPKPASESIASAVSDKYSEAVSAASVAVYGTPTPAVESIASVIGEAGEEKFEAMKLFVSELISGKEPSFTESVMSRLSSQWYGTVTPLASRATEAAEEAYARVTEGAQALMTPPPAIESILDVASSQIAGAVVAASEVLYGTEKGKVEQATSAAAAAASSASAVISSIIYGRETPAAEKVQQDIIAALENARSQISIAIVGTPQGTVESVTSVAGESLSQATDKAGENVAKAQEVVADTYSSASKAVEKNVSAASSVASSLGSKVSVSVSTALYGRDKTYMESAQSRLDAAVQTASAQLKEMFLGRDLTFGERLSQNLGSAYAQATNAAGNVYASAASAAGGAYDSAASAAGEAYGNAASAAGEVYDSASSVVSKAADAVVPSQEPEGVTGTVSSVASSIASEIHSRVSKLKDEL